MQFGSDEFNFLVSVPIIAAMLRGALVSLLIFRIKFFFSNISITYTSTDRWSKRSLPRNYTANPRKLWKVILISIFENKIQTLMFNDCFVQEDNTINENSAN